MPLFAIPSVTQLLFPSDPALWQCPIQQGVPFLLGWARELMILGAAILFFYGIISAVVNYLTAFGNEEKAKLGQKTLQWTVIGAIVIILSELLIQQVANMFLAPGQNTTLANVGAPSNCQPAASDEIAPTQP